jgi:hypothetical protein
MGIVTVCVYGETGCASGPLARGGGATGMGATFGNQVRVVKLEFGKTPIQVVNIRLVPVDAGGNSGEAGEGLQLITR